MKNLNEKINESISNPSDLKMCIKVINELIDDDPSSVDEVIYELLDGISNNKEDDLVIDNIQSWLDSK